MFNEVSSSFVMEQVDQLGDQLSESRSQNTRVATQLQYMEDKEKLLQANVDLLKSQLLSLEEKNKLLVCSQAKHEHSIAVLKGEHRMIFLSTTCPWNFIG